MSPVSNIEFPVNKSFQENFLHFKEIHLRYFVSALSLSNLNGFALFFFEHAHKNIPDITVSLEYFIAAGERSYIDGRHVGMPKHQFSCLASNTP
jgi:hypothetical protein